MLEANNIIPPSAAIACLHFRRTWLTQFRAGERTAVEPWRQNLFFFVLLFVARKSFKVLRSDLQCFPMCGRVIHFNKRYKQTGCRAILAAAAVAPGGVRKILKLERILCIYFFKLRFRQSNLDQCQNQGYQHVSLVLSIFGQRVMLETMKYFGPTTNKLCMQNSQTEAAWQPCQRSLQLIED